MPGGHRKLKSFQLAQLVYDVTVRFFICQKVMNPELREFIEQARFCRASVQRVAELLPPVDAELDALIAEIAGENNPKAFLHVVVAALGQGRRVEARHLARGASLLGHATWVGSVMFKVQGDVPEQTMAAIENSQLPFPVEAGTLLAL